MSSGRWISMPVLVAAIALLVGGCGGGPEDSDGGRSAAEARPPVSRAQYSAALRLAAKRVDRAMDGVRGARSRSALIKQAKRAQSLIDRARADLTRVKPPTAVARDHRRTTDALGKLAQAAGSLDGAIDSGEICATPSAIATLSRSVGARRLRSAAAKLRADGYRAARKLAPSAMKIPNRRLANGAILRQAGGGAGTLTVRNGTSNDGVVKLAGGGRGTVLSLYVRQGSSATARGIPNGKLRVYFATGRDWDARRNTFTRRCQFTRFDDTLDYVSSYGSYSAATITLHPVVGGGASTSRIGAGDFPR